MYPSFSRLCYFSVLPSPKTVCDGVGTTFIEHAPTASFPSNHMLIFSTIALSYLFAQRKIIGIILLFLSFMVAWSRIYLGVHFL